MKERLHAVITGDIIGSTKIEKDYHQILQGISNSIGHLYDTQPLLEVYRGDSFQSHTPESKDGLYLLLILKSGLRRFTAKNSKSIEDALDARLSLGIGTIKDPIESKTLGKQNGDAFVKSGRALDQMKKEGSMIKITTGIDSLDEEFKAVCPLIESVTSKWSTSQAEAVYFYLLKQSTQKSLGEMLGISQRGVGKRLDSSNIEEILHFNEYFKKRIEWMSNM